MICHFLSLLISQQMFEMARGFFAFQTDFCDFLVSYLSRILVEIHWYLSGSELVPNGTRLGLSLKWSGLE